MNTDEILKTINREEAEYFNKRKDYSVFSKHFNFKSFFIMNGDSLLFPSFFLAVAIMPLIINMQPMILSLFSIPMALTLSLGSLLTIFFSPMLISYCFYKFITRKNYFKTQNNSEAHDVYIKNKIQPFFDDLIVSSDFMDILKKELSDEQFILLNMDYPNLSYKDLKKWLNKQTEVNKIKDIQGKAILTSRSIKRYRKKIVN